MVVNGKKRKNQKVDETLLGGLARIVVGKSIVPKSNRSSSMDRRGLRMRIEKERQGNRQKESGRG